MDPHPTDREIDAMVSTLEKAVVSYPNQWWRRELLASAYARRAERSRDILRTMLDFRRARSLRAALKGDPSTSDEWRSNDESGPCAAPTVPYDTPTIEVITPQLPEPERKPSAHWLVLAALAAMAIGYFAPLLGSSQQSAPIMRASALAPDVQFGTAVLGTSLQAKRQGSDEGKGEPAVASRDGRLHARPQR